MSTEDPTRCSRCGSAMAWFVTPRNRVLCDGCLQDIDPEQLEFEEWVPGHAWENVKPNPRFL